MRKWIFGIMLVGLAGAGPATQPVETGSIAGRVSIGGSLGLQKPDLTRVVVFVGSNEATKRAAGPTTRAVVAQRNKAFVPNFVVVPVGTEVEFPNWDKFDHNVFSRSAAAPAFDLDRYPYGQSKTRTFDKLGVVQVFCNIHPQMRAIIYVTPNSLFARCDAEGNFKIEGAPAGKYDVVAWQERCEEQRQGVEVTAGQAGQVNFALTEKHELAVSNSDVNRKASYGVERGLGTKRDVLNLPVVTEVHPAPEDSKP